MVNYKKCVPYRLPIIKYQQHICKTEAQGTEREHVTSGIKTLEGHMTEKLEILCLKIVNYISVK